MKPEIKKFLTYGNIVIDGLLALLFLMIFIDDPSDVVFLVLTFFPLVSIYLHIDHAIDLNSKIKMGHALETQKMLNRDREQIRAYFKEKKDTVTDVSDVQDLREQLNGQISEETEEGKQI